MHEKEGTSVQLVIRTSIPNRKPRTRCKKVQNFPNFYKISLKDCHSNYCILLSIKNEILIVKNQWINWGELSPIPANKMEAVSGFEPEKNGVANRCLKHSATPPLNPIYLRHGN